MATGSTIHKAQLGVSDMDRHHYADYDLTVAQHPSETDFRMMVRLIAFALNADEHLTFTKGLCVEDEPELWRKNYGGEIELWIDLGQPDEKRIRKACGRAEEVIVYTYQRGSAKAWFDQQKGKLERFKNLTIIHLDIEGSPESLAQRSMELQCNIQDGVLTMHGEGAEITVRPEVWKAPLAR